ncbi:ThiF family adenylyltransferase [Streptomyces sp. NBC_00568]|uniref:ThiF family adenylyltransferase n=1 Tax=Streptomyces sp. NBC_00568 TaxID=2975779 RepID=UPI0022579E97|nr:ThiF family adenylyltransferase [Streptomyces sp. NBC_00568]MCX4988455.1 ThiF family adenylyltransferase [Streptomyces sp. NBC_00568]
MDNRDVARLRITVAGLGSGGAMVIQQLAMCGIRQWDIFDPDILEPVNLIKHPALRSQLGMPKAEAMQTWLHDRNPGAQVNAYSEDVRKSSAFVSAASESDLIISAVDDPASRNWINTQCVQIQRPCITGSVIRTGLGGEVYLYAPGETGCLSCMQLVADRNDMNIEDAFDLTDEEKKNRYGLGESDFATSGLAIDVTLVASFHAHMAWSTLMGDRSPYVPQLNFNWLTMGIRPEPGVFSKHYEISRLLIKAQKECYLACGADHGRVEQ